MNNCRIASVLLVAAIAGTSANAAETAISIGFGAGDFQTTVDIGFDQLVKTETGYSFNGGGWEWYDTALGDLLGGIDSLNMNIKTDATRAGSPQTVTLDFSFSAGFMNSSFTVNANPLVFSPITSVVGVASAALTVQDRFNDGVTVSPNGAGAYSALYNGGAVFGDLFTGGVITGAGGTSANDVTNSGSYSFVAASVSDISAKWDFTISAFDSATGTSVFTVVPTPASAALLGLGGLVATRRRR
ncbi:MAG: hypothetical protein ACI89L_002485 [Phycisphaerales bacterium]|jgi:hypothetical protein